MATCACMGEAVGLAVSIAAREQLSPRETGRLHLHELQQALLWNDCYLPHFLIENSELSSRAALSVSSGNAETLRSGTIRGENGVWNAAPGGWAQYDFAAPEKVTEVRIVFDSDTAERLRSMKRLNMRSNIPLKPTPFELPQTLVRHFRVTAENEQGCRKILLECTDNCRRLVVLPVNENCRNIRLEILDREPKNVISFRIR